MIRVIPPTSLSQQPVMAHPLGMSQTPTYVLRRRILRSSGMLHWKRKDVTAEREKKKRKTTTEGAGMDHILIDLYSQNPHGNTYLFNKGAAAGAREPFSFTRRLTAMQKGIILAFGINFLYETSRHFVSAPTALLSEMLTKVWGMANAYGTAAKDLALNSGGQLAERGMEMDNGMKEVRKGLTPNNGTQ
ncbi:hypothetical protein V492_01103 [Pseudogymnoascus sp. VKM F-4246]|nr:hypothetical protein V492_01103 [Pseudogymnoascus sp. VKM F-4246]